MTAGSQLRLFERMLAVLSRPGRGAPVLLELEDVHWADVSTLDLVVFLAHNIDDRSIVLLSTFRADDPSSAARMRTVLPTRVRRSGRRSSSSSDRSQRDELDELVAARPAARFPHGAGRTIAVRSEGNPFFAEELVAAAADAAGATSSRGSSATCCCSAWSTSISARSTCCGWPRRPAATSPTRCFSRPRACLIDSCEPRCAVRSSTACSSPTARRAPSASATPCWPTPCTRRSCRASARSCTSASPKRW